MFVYSRCLLFLEKDPRSLMLRTLALSPGWIVYKLGVSGDIPRSLVLRTLALRSLIESVNRLIWEVRLLPLVLRTLALRSG